MTVIPLQSLSHHISAIPKLDKEQFVSSFIQEQKAHSKAYVQEGQDHVASWNRPQVLWGAQATTEYGFGTPVLKPRVPRNIPGSCSPCLPADRDCVEMDPSHIESRQKPVKRKRRSPAQKAKHKAKSHSVNHQTSDDGERAKRLKDRRERKRMRRAIMHSKDGVDAGWRAEDKEKKKQSCKDHVPASLALMYGFSATNVKSGRLTIQSSTSLGVFGKGKASVKTRVVERKSSKRRASKKDTKGFSEAAFLNKASKSFKDQSKLSSLSCSSESTLSTTSGVSTRGKAQSTGSSGSEKLNGKDAKPNEKPCDPSDLRPRLGRSETNGSLAESIVWDIERDDFVLPERNTSRDSAANTVLLDTRRLIWSTGLPGETGAPDNGPPSRISGIVPSKLAGDSHSVCSITPSLSASQRPVHELPVGSSKYFAISAIQPQEEKESSHLPGYPVGSALEPGSPIDSVVFLASEAHQTPHSPTAPIQLSIPRSLPFSESPLPCLGFNDLLEVEPCPYQSSEPEVLPVYFPQEIVYDDELHPSLLENYTNPGSYFGSQFPCQSEDFLEWDERSSDLPFENVGRCEVQPETTGSIYFLGEDDEIPHPDCYDENYDFLCNAEDLQDGGEALYRPDCEEGRGVSTNDFQPGGSVMSSLDDSSEIEENAKWVETDCMLSQGRALLFGCAERIRQDDLATVQHDRQISNVENDVAKSLKNHWRRLRLG